MQNIFFLTYAAWKAARTAIGGTTYLVTSDAHYIGIVLKTDGGHYEVYCAEIVRFPDDANLSDFETNIVPTAVPVTTIEEVISIELT